MRVDSLQHFAVSVHTAHLPGFAAYAEPLREELLGLARTTASEPRTNRTSWHSRCDLHVSPSGALAQAVAELASFAQAGVGARRRVRLTECWAVVGERGAWHVPHNHYPEPYSGVLYVDAERAVAGQREHDRSGKIEFLNPVSPASAFGQPTGVAYTPRDGLALLFPGALMHMVHPNASAVPRVTMGFNVAFDDEEARR